MKYCIIIPFLIFLSQDGFCEIPFPSVNEHDLPDARFEKPKTFTRTSLFGYINGAAELYLEYGFTDAWICEIELSGGKFTTEIYKMGSPEDAFGIFSVSRFRCQNIPSLSPFTCHTRYQLQVCSGSFYISIINSSGNKTDSVASVKIAQAIVHKIKESSAYISGFLPDVPPEIVNQKAVFAKGILGVMNGSPDWEGFFRNAKGYSAVILQDEDQISLSVKFATKEELNGFMALHNWDPQTISAGKTKMPAGEVLSLLSENHLLIEIRTKT